MSRSPRPAWLLAGIGGMLCSRLVLAQPAGQTPTPTEPDKAASEAAAAQPARPEPGAGVQPTPPATTEIKPTPPAPAPARPAEALPPPFPPPPGGRLSTDELRDPGYVPGYKRYMSLGMPPYSPSVGALPGGLTPGYGAPMPPGEWTFQWTGYLSASAQYGTYQRPAPAPGQSTTVFHVPPVVIDEYQSFVGTSTLPGQWVAMNFKYGNRDVSALVTLSTYNPSEPTTYNQLGSQGFVNNAYLAYNIPALGRLRLHATVGYFFNNYGNLGQYGPGIYQSPIAGGPRGVGGTLLGEVQLSPTLLLLVEAGVMGSRLARSPAGTAPASPDGQADPIYPASYIRHLHAGLINRSGPLVIRLNLHYMYNWAQDDRVQTNCFLTAPDGATPGAPGVFVCQRNADNMTTRGVNENYIPDGHISVVAGDVEVGHSIWGQLGIGAAHIDALNSYLIQGLLTYGGQGQQLAERWLGVDTFGTGQVDVVGVNYNGSLGRMINAPGPFDPNSPDLILNAGAIFATSHSANSYFDGRNRYKFGVDALYAFAPFMAAGVRFDRVAPNSHDAEETFHVLATRLVFKTDWASRETVSIIYARWFFGPHSHPEYSVLLPDRLDDQLIALNVNMWW